MHFRWAPRILVPIRKEREGERRRGGVGCQSSQRYVTTSSMFESPEYSVFVSIGPAFNLFLRKTNFWMGPFKINRLTSPGVSISLNLIDLRTLAQRLVWLAHLCGETRYMHVRPF